MSETWRRTEALDPETHIETDVDVKVVDGVVRVPVETLRRFLRSVGYEVVRGGDDAA